jgi:hypothetical protein
LFLLQIFPFTLFGFITAGRQRHAFSIDVSGCQKIQAGTGMVHIHQGLIQMLDVDAVKLDYSKQPKVTEPIFQAISKFQPILFRISFLSVLF